MVRKDRGEQINRNKAPQEEHRATSDAAKAALQGKQ